MKMLTNLMNSGDSGIFHRNIINKRLQLLIEPVRRCLLLLVHRSFFFGGLHPVVDKNPLIRFAAAAAAVLESAPDIHTGRGPSRRTELGNILWTKEFCGSALGRRKLFGRSPFLPPWDDGDQPTDQPTNEPRS